MSLGSEFKEFAMKGNVIDLAVGVVIGAAFGKIVASLVGDIIMPPIGMLTGGINFTDLAVKLGLDPTGKPYNPFHVQYQRRSERRLLQRAYRRRAVLGLLKCQHRNDQLRNVGRISSREVAGEAPFITKWAPSKKSAEYSGYDAIA